MSEHSPIVEELLSGPYPCFLATIGEDGRPYAVVVWCGPEGDRVTVNAAEGRWLRNLRRDPRVSIVVLDTANILRHAAMQGTVTSIDPDCDYSHINSLSQVYEGRPYAYETPLEAARFKVTIEPRAIRTFELPPPDG